MKKTRRERLNEAADEMARTTIDEWERQNLSPEEMDRRMEAFEAALNKLSAKLAGPKRKRTPPGSESR